jgi:diguanylate cyclase (GGDEF)-like protein
MNALAFIVWGLILYGVGILVCSLWYASRIIAALPAGTAKRWWRLLRALIVLSVIGYLASVALFPRTATAQHLIVAAVYLGGALFVLLVSLLNLQTVHDIRRIATLEFENVRDPLLGIFNRRFLEQRLREEVARTRRYASPLSLLLLDIDRFKRINDAHGHQVGDQVLRRIAQLLRTHTREPDVVGRYGGEEIAILLPNTGESGARTVAERIRLSIERTPMLEEAQPKLHCTVSLGIATLETEPCDGEELLRRADAALYQAKGAGRNCAIAHSDKSTHIAP